MEELHDLQTAIYSLEELYPMLNENKKMALDIALGTMKKRIEELKSIRQN